MPSLAREGKVTATLQVEKQNVKSINHEDYLWRLKKHNTLNYDTRRCSYQLPE